MATLPFCLASRRRARSRRGTQRSISSRLREVSASPTPASRVLRDELEAALGADRVTDGDSARDLHARDLTFHPAHLPDLVVYAATTDDVAKVLAIASAHRVPVTPFAAGTSLEGHVIPVHGGISLDLSGLTGTLEISPGDLTATVSAGVTRLTLERAAGEHGLFFPVDPGADATLGGMAATNAAGTTTVRYGKMRTNLLALEAVLAGRQHRPHRLPRAQDVGRLRPHRAPRRVGGDAGA